jgi:hypothetical protein
MHGLMGWERQIFGVHWINRNHMNSRERNIHINNLNADSSNHREESYLSNYVHIK